MSDLNAAPPPMPARPLAPRVNALQGVWLRELGVPKSLVPVALRVQAPDLAEPADPHPAAPQAGAADSVSPDVATKAPPAISDKSSPVADAMRLLGVGRTTPSVPQAPAATALSPAMPRSPGDIEQADLDTLTAMVQTCGACSLCASRQHAVFGSGSVNAEWMVVGEAPGEQEDMQALPFVGKSGQLLTEMLRAVGVDREQDVFISNVIKCRPPGNRNPQPEEIAQCKPFLMRQISLVAPKRLLVLGRFAAQVLLGSDANLGTLRGQVHTFVDAQGRSIPMVVSYHPAYLLRSPQEKARAWRDLRMAAAHTV